MSLLIYMYTSRWYVYVYVHVYLSVFYVYVYVYLSLFSICLYLSVKYMKPLSDIRCLCFFVQGSHCACPQDPQDRGSASRTIRRVSLRCGVGVRSPPGKRFYYNRLRARRQNIAHRLARPENKSIKIGYAPGGRI